MSAIHPATRAALLTGAVGLAGCATSARLDRVMREDPAQASGYVVVAREEASSLVTLFREGRPVAARPPLTLQPGDELETGAGGAAIIHFPDGGSVVVDASSRVRLGSLEVLFGRVFAAVRGLFSVENENIIAGVEGTEFAFDASPARGVHVVVLQGVVRCTSKAGRWAAIRLRPGQALTTRPSGLEPPLVAPASQRELDSIRAWVKRLTSAARSGYCCDAGRVFPTQSDACRGAFFTDPKSAQRACQPRPEPSGWCCDAGRVTSTTRTQCRGAFFTDPRRAQRACQPPPEPSGWCCLSAYRLEPMTAPACAARKGTFYPDETTARNKCAIP